jgi:RHS repeat-associated protein
MKIDSNEHSYDYDKLYQLVNVDYSGGSGMTIGYDKLGNRTSTVNGATVTYDSNSLNQYTQINGEAYTYDDNGNMTHNGVENFNYAYDCQNRLTTVTGVAWYRYDYLGRRIKKPYGSGHIRYVYDGEQVAAEYSNTGALLRKFVYGPGIDEPVCMIDVEHSNAVYYYHFDGLGNVVALATSGGTILEKYSYDVFGTPNTTSSVGNPYFFTGRAYDSNVKLYYYRARFYSPALGRFLQPDPVGYEAGLNLYTYCGNNAVNWIDPMGLLGAYPAYGGRGGGSWGALGHGAAAAGWGTLGAVAGASADFVGYPPGAPSLVDLLPELKAAKVSFISTIFGPYEDDWRELSKDALNKMREEWKKANEPPPKPK